MTAKKAIGQNTETSDGSDFNVMRFVVQQAINLMSTATLVKVTKVTTTGLVAPVGVVSVQPLVNLVDGIGNATSHGLVHNLPYFRLQGGSDKAIILDPKVGDIGVAVFADRDISSVKKNKAKSNPASRRRFNMADGMYFGSFLGAAPTSYLQFQDDGQIVASPDSGATQIRASQKAILNSAKKVVLNGQASAANTSQDQAAKNAIKAQAVSDLNANPDAKSVSMSTTLPSGSTYNYTVTRQ